MSASAHQMSKQEEVEAVSHLPGPYMQHACGKEPHMPLSRLKCRLEAYIKINDVAMDSVQTFTPITDCEWLRLLCPSYFTDHRQIRKKGNGKSA
jgi:hypothetical protein